MRKFWLALFTTLLGIVFIFPPMHVEAKYLDKTESATRLLPVWSDRTWQNGQVMYQAEINVGLFVATIVVLLWIGVMGWLYRSRFTQA